MGKKPFLTKKGAQVQVKEDPAFRNAEFFNTFSSLFLTFMISR